MANDSHESLCTIFLRDTRTERSRPKSGAEIPEETLDLHIAISFKDIEILVPENRKNLLRIVRP